MVLHVQTNTRFYPLIFFIEDALLQHMDRETFSYTSYMNIIYFPLIFLELDSV